MNMEINDDLVKALLSEFFDEYRRARTKFPAMRSRHEGYGIIKEEFDEFWEAIMTNQLSVKLEEETIQLGAMVLAFLSEIIYDCSISSSKKEENMYPPTTLEIAEKRGWAEEEWRAFFGRGDP